MIMSYSQRLLVCRSPPVHCDFAQGDAEHQVPVPDRQSCAGLVRPTRRHPAPSQELALRGSELKCTVPTPAECKELEFKTING